MNDLDALGSGSLKGALEAMLVASTDPTPATDFARVLGRAPGDVVEALTDLAAEYHDKGRGLALREVAGGWRLFTPPTYHDAVEALVLSWDTRKLTQAALETLAVVAYLQPVTRDGVRAIRGVNSEGTIASLIDKGLVRELGRDKERGQAILYGTTRRFLEQFGLKTVRDLPPLEEFAPDEQTRAFITERLQNLSRSPEPEAKDNNETAKPAEALPEKAKEASGPSLAPIEASHESLPNAKAKAEIEIEIEAEPSQESQ